MKKVIIYTENYMYGGLERFLFDFVKHYKDDLFVLFNKENERILDFVKKNNIPYQTVEIKANLRFLKPQNINTGIKNIKNIYSRIKGILNSYFYLIYNYFYLKKILSRYHNYDNIVFINGGYPGAGSCISGVFASKKINIKNIILVVLSSPFEYPKNPILKKIKKCVDKYIDKKVMESVNKIVTNCEDASKKFIEIRGFNKNKIKTIYSGICISREISKINEIETEKMILSRNNDDIWLGMAGILGSTKAQAVLIMAMSIVNNYNKNVKCLIVGDGPEYENLQNLTEKLGLSNYIFFIERLPNLSSFYRFIDIYVLSSFYEGLPYTITEAMSYKIPIVATRVGGIPEQIEEDVNGYLVDKNNPKQLAEKILKMIEKRDKWAIFGEKNYEKVCSNFKLETMLENINCLLV